MRAGFDGAVGAGRPAPQCVVRRLATTARVMWIDVAVKRRRRCFNVDTQRGAALQRRLKRARNQERDVNVAAGGSAAGVAMSLRLRGAAGDGVADVRRRFAALVVIAEGR